MDPLSLPQREKEARKEENKTSLLPPKSNVRVVDMYVQRGVNLFELFAKHQPGVAGCGWLQPGRNFLST